MAVGLPIVVTPRGMLPQIAKADPGAPADLPAPGLVAAETPEALAAALLRLAGDPALRVAVGDAARGKVERAMDPQRAARRLVEFYGRLARRAGFQGMSGA
jgi:glycosyltransferase involved in cell wall biosynthesis